MEELFFRKESQVYCDEGGGNFDISNYVVVVEGDEGYHRYMVVVMCFCGEGRLG